MVTTVRYNLNYGQSLLYVLIEENKSFIMNIFKNRTSDRLQKARDRCLLYFQSAVAYTEFQPPVRRIAATSTQTVNEKENA